MTEPRPPFNPADIPSIKSQTKFPKRAVVTAGMPYANGPLHLGHLAGTHVPADIYSRFLRMMIGSENVLYVCGTDDHGSTSELAAFQAGKSVQDFIGAIHEKQRETMRRYSIGLDVYTGTSRPECFSHHSELCQDFIRKLHKNGMLEKRVSQQWFDPKLSRFLQDRLVRGTCPNSKCGNDKAYSDECDQCGMQYQPYELVSPKSAVSDGVPVLKDTVHWWLDIWKVSELLRVWIQGKEKTWRHALYHEVINTVMPALQFDNTHEARYKELKEQLPKHKSKYAAGKKVALTFENKIDLENGRKFLEAQGIPTQLLDAWAHRPISRDVSWGIPMPVDLDPEMKGKTLYVWPDSLIAPISFSKVALKEKGRDPSEYRDFWNRSDARVSQFLGQDNVYFYVLMQGALWIGSQDDPSHLPKEGDLQMTEILSCFHLMVGGEKMSKSRGNFYTGDQLLDEKGYDADQIRYFLSLLTLPEKSSNFDFAALDERNQFLAGPMNAAFEKPISACHSKFDGKVPEGKLNEKVQLETANLIRKYLRSMDRGEYSTLLNLIENYARQINSLFTQFKPHDDRAPEEQRRDALYSCFYVLKNLMIMLYPFVPATMIRLRESLRLPEEVFCLAELGTGITAGHIIGEKQQYFPGSVRIGQ
ncbi:MAG: class I tRNA ligase family protein [Bdellovibrionales bacterium]|nr:class I tRNA ligase family protein [Bdellovibrionales bacterium]